MKLKELYTFALNNNLENEDVYKVINKFNSSLYDNKPINTPSFCNLPFNIYKVYYTYEDVVELFNN